MAEKIKENQSYLGTLCKRGHEYENTGKSLRTSLYKRCVKCRAIDNHRYNSKNQLKVNKRNKKWRESKGGSDYFARYRRDNRESYNRMSREWKKKNPKKAKLAWQKDARKRRDELSDRYLLNILRIQKDRATKELIEAKRLHILIHRLIKERKQIQ